MRHFLLRAVEALLLPTVALGVVAAAAPSRLPLAAHVYLLVVCGAALGALVAALRRAYPSGPSPFERALVTGSAAAPERLPQLARLEREVTLASANAFDLHFRLRPILRETAGGLLAARGVDLDHQPERARALLGDDLWQLVRGDRREPLDRTGPGIPPARLRDTLERLEALA